MAQRFDIAIVGGGMAGASLAAHLAPHARVLLLEAEARHGYHATGRSVAFWTESYGGPGVQPLTTASGPYLVEHGFVARRGALTIAREDDAPALAAFAETFGAQGVRIDPVERAELERLVPGLRTAWTRGVMEPTCSDVDVAALHQHYLALARRGGAELRTAAAVTAIMRTAQGWDLTLTDGGRCACDLLADAAGAWADAVAALAGVRPIGIAPLRRTVAQVRIAPPAPDAMPLVLDVGERFYFKPEQGRIWLSPHDETPSVPCDAGAEEIDVALAIDRLEGVVDWRIGRIEHRWAGLRSFAPDRLPVYGFDARDERFFWFAGQGGFGIQTAPAAAALAAALILGMGEPPVDPARYAAARFA